MIAWLLRRSLLPRPWRVALEAITMAFPVAMLAATLWYVDTAIQSMTPNAFANVQVEMRGASTGQVAGLAMVQAAVAGVAGSVLGLRAAALAVSAVVGHPVWQDLPPVSLWLSAGIAVLAGVLGSGLRLLSPWRANRGSDLAERQLLKRGWKPA